MTTTCASHGAHSVSPGGDRSRARRPAARALNTSSGYLLERRAPAGQRREQHQGTARRSPRHLHPVKRPQRIKLRLCELEAQIVTTGARRQGTRTAAPSPRRSPPPAPAAGCDRGRPLAAHPRGPQVHRRPRPGIELDRRAVLAQLEVKGHLPHRHRELRPVFPGPRPEKDPAGVRMTSVRNTARGPASGASSSSASTSFSDAGPPDPGSCAARRRRAASRRRGARSSERGTPSARWRSNCAGSRRR